MFTKYNELRELYKENREILMQHDGVKMMNYLFDIKNTLVGLLEKNEIEKEKYEFIFHDKEIPGEFIIQLIDEYEIKVHARTKGYLQNKCYRINSVHGSGKTAPTQKTFETIEEIQKICKEKYKNNIEDNIKFYEKILNDKIEIAEKIFKQIIQENK